MLYKLSANKPSFRDIVFSKGLNIVVAERTEASGNKASRNALGKTTFVEILDFCLGADFTKKSKLYSPNLLDWSFSLEMELAGYHFEVTRHINDAKKIYIHPFCKNFPLELKEQGDKQTYIDLEEWKLLLGKSLFDIDQMQHKKPNAPTARSILGYFIRKSGAYKEPFYTFKHQKAVQWQINNAFVLNLLWAKSLELHNLQVENEKYSNLIATYKSIGNTTGKLNAQKIILSNEIDKLQKDIQNFNVLPEYKEIQVVANTLTKKLQSLNNQMIFNKKRLEEYNSIISEEDVSDDLQAITAMYKEVNIVFSETVLKSLEEVQKFNSVIIQNRKEFLQNEVRQLEREIFHLETSIKSYSEERSEKMKLLSAHGALEEYSILQEKLSKKVSELELLKQDLKKQQDAQEKIYTIKARKDSIKYEINQDISINENLKEEILIFNNNSMCLYDMYANLVVDTDKNGNYKFYISREKSSEGIERMDIFCYDLMLIEMYRKNVPQGIDFLIHDSTLYDAVDSRQRAKAIELANEKSNQHDFQYIFTINSDQLPLNDFSESFNYNDYVVKYLTDKDISGSLLGITFSSPVDKEVSEENL